jgi:hypothetical protein
MSAITAGSLSLDQVKAEFQAWRKRRVGRERIPGHLWTAAIELLNYHPISVVQKQLNLNLKQLKQRLADSRLDKHPLSKPQFLEIKGVEIAAVGGQPPAANNRRPNASARQLAEPIDSAKAVCRIAFEHSDGSRLQISLPADSQLIPAICANLLRDDRRD